MDRFSWDLSGPSGEFWEGTLELVSERTLLNKFSGCVRPGEMLFVLERPGSDGYNLFL